MAPPRRARRNLHFSHMDEASKKRAGGQHDSGAGNRSPIRQNHPGDLCGCNVNVPDFTLDDMKVRGAGDGFLDGPRIEFAVGLGARSAHCRPLASVEQAELNTGCIGGTTHQSVEGIDLANEMTLAETADGRVAGHRADRGS